MKSLEKQYILSGDGNKNVLQTIRDVYMLRGLSWIVSYGFLSIISYILSPLWSVFYFIRYKTYQLPKQTFLFKNVKYHYFHHFYNYTWRCERIIEIPLIKKELDTYKDKKVLEIGNVFSHYYKSSHDIVDNYEIAKGVINEDIMHYTPKRKYDFIFSISTIEHIGVDGVKKSRKAVQSLLKMKKLLKKGGKLLFTIPLGYNSSLDEAIWNKKLNLSHAYFFKRISQDNKWIEVNEEKSKTALYGFPYRWGNIIVLATLRNN